MLYLVENDAIISWRSYKGTSTTTGVLENSEPAADNWDPAPADPTSPYVVEMVTNQYCNNRDTIQLINKPGIAPTMQSTLPDSCFDTKGKLEVGGLSAKQALTSLFDWQSLNSDYDVTPSFLSNTADIKLVKKGQYIYLLCHFTRHLYISSECRSSYDWYQASRSICDG
jgi:hypothetical protein